MNESGQTCNLVHSRSLKLIQMDRANWLILKVGNCVFAAVGGFEEDWWNDLYIKLGSD